MALPMEPTSGAESKVEQTLYCVIGAPSAKSQSKTAGRFASIQAGSCPRAVPAMPMAPQWRKRSNCAGVGGAAKSTLSTPAKAITSSASVEPVKSSP